MIADPHAAPIHVDDVPQQSWDVGELNAKRRRIGVAVGAARLGVAIIEVGPGARATPPHSHADEDELFLVLEGGGLSWQSSGGKDARTYAISEGDVLFHESGGDAHTLIAGPEGLTVLVLAEGSRTNITYMPRTRMFWLGPRWSPADAPPRLQQMPKPDRSLSPNPHRRDRKRSSHSQRACPLNEEREGRFGTSYRDPGKAAGARRLVMAVDDVPPGLRTYPRHWHTAREECFYVLSGSGSVEIGDSRHELRSGSFFLRPPDGGVPHTIDAGDDGLRYVTMGDMIPGDVCVYPDSGKVKLGRGLFVRAEPVDYYDGEDCT